MTHKEIHGNLQDYVLGLLSPGQNSEVVEHLTTCSSCRQIVIEEREVGILVRSALSCTETPDKARLRSLMPAVPKNPKRRLVSAWTPRLAPAMIALLLIAGSLLVFSPDPQRQMSFFAAGTVTATSTNTPTATIAQETKAAHPQTTTLLRELEIMTLVSPGGDLGAPIPSVPTPARPRHRSRRLIR